MSEEKKEAQEEEDGPLPLKRILRIAAREKTRILWGIVLMLLSQAGGLVWPLATGWMIDATAGNSAWIEKGESIALLAAVLLF